MSGVMKRTLAILECLVDQNSGVGDLCQPVLDALADTSGELVRLGVVDVDHLTWTAKSQSSPAKPRRLLTRAYTGRELEPA